MKLMLSSVGIALAAIMAVFAYGTVQAESASHVRLALVQAAGADAKFERIDIENATNTTVDVTDWKMVYKSASGSTTTLLLQLTTDPNIRVLLDAGKRETFVSKEMASALGADGVLKEAQQFAGGMNHLGGGLQLIDSSGQVVDMLGWGTASATVRLGDAAPAPTTTSWLIRQSDIGNNAVDFVLKSQDSMQYPIVAGSLYEVQDVCANIVGLQENVPEGYMLLADSCVPIDACSNLEGIQMQIPAGMEQAASGECQQSDMCSNIDGIQESIPVGYEPVDGGQCEVMIPVRQLKITELLPNPSGGDAGNEFIELYNAESEPVTLNDYQLAIGDKLYAFPANRIIQPGSYMTFSDTDIGGSLPNTTGVQVWLLTARGVEVDSVPAYENARDDVSWARINGEWQYTYDPTPGEQNSAAPYSLCQPGYLRDDETHRCRKPESEIGTSAASCRDGQYRSDETGRCRNVVAASTLMPCKDGQYRSEETNRCRLFATLAASAVKPCADDQFRNPLTNRCKSIASSDDAALVDCGEGRERNPVTNRCRNVASAAVSTAAFPVESVEDTATAFAGWWALGGVGVLALGYAGWEWRHEVAEAILRVRAAFTSK